jgi:hypothetical protein
MSMIPQRSDLLSRVAESPFAFVLTVACAASLIWLSHRPPMTDLPQHAAQVALWHDLLLGQSPWVELFRINLLTPYLTGYTLALLLSFVVSAVTAVKLVLTAAFVAFVVSCVQLRRDFGADKRLDWLMIPGFFGFSYDWGFYSFLVAAPIGVHFIRRANQHACAANVRQGDVRQAAMLIALGVLLLFSHGLMFLFAGLVGGVLLLANASSVRAFVRGAAAYAVLAVLCIAFVVASRSNVAPADATTLDWVYSLFERPLVSLVSVQSTNALVFAPLTLAMMIAPVVLGLSWSWRAALPLAVVVALLLAFPATFYDTFHVFQRFAMFLLPFLALAYSAHTRPMHPGRTLLGCAMLVIPCGLSLAIHAYRTLGFAHEMSGFEVVLAAAEPGRRAASVTRANMASVATGQTALALYQPAWYQADKHGLVEFNFAFYHPQVVRYKPGVVPFTGFGFTAPGARFDWSQPQSRIFDYYFVRQAGDALPAEFIANPACTLRLVKASGAWSLFERGACKG